MKTTHALVLASLCLLAASRATADDLKADGHVSSGLDTHGANQGRSRYEAKLKLKTKRSEQGVRAVMSFEGEAGEEAVTLDDAYADWKLGKQQSLSFGLMEKRLGLEAERSSGERVTIKHTPLYDKLRDFAYVGRALQVKYEQETDGGGSFAVALGHANSYDVFLTAHAERTLVKDWMRGGVWALAQSDRIDNGYQRVFGLAAALWSEHAAVDYELELMAGTDPYESEYEAHYGDGKKVVYTGAKLLAGYRFTVAEAAVLEPFVTGTYVLHDTGEKDRAGWQRLAGLNLTLHERLRLALNAGVVSGYGKPSSLTSLSERTLVSFEARYDF